MSAPVVLAWLVFGARPVPKRPVSCRLCNTPLREHEKAEMECDRCLRVNSWRAAA